MMDPATFVVETFAMIRNKRDRSVVRIQTIQEAIDYIESNMNKEEA